jgi:hypothetical protein
MFVYASDDSPLESGARGSSSVGGSVGLQNRRSQVRVLAAPPSPPDRGCVPPRWEPPQATPTRRLRSRVQLAQGYHLALVHHPDGHPLLRAERYGRNVSRYRVVPNVTLSPGRTSTSSVTRQPFTRVPLVEPKSVRNQRSSRRDSRACVRETVRSEITQSQRGERPTVTIARPAGSASRGMRGSRHAASSAAANSDILATRRAVNGARTVRSAIASCSSP